MADCGVIADPKVEQLADIAVDTARFARHVLNARPRVALLSFSTKGSTSHPSASKVQAATALAQQKAAQKLIQADFDGEFKPTPRGAEIAERKCRQQGRGHASADFPRPQFREHCEQTRAPLATQPWTKSCSD
jgi:phosphate acetyltransferase